MHSWTRPCAGIDQLNFGRRARIAVTMWANARLYNIDSINSVDQNCADRQFGHSRSGPPSTVAAFSTGPLDMYTVRILCAVVAIQAARAATVTVRSSRPDGVGCEFLRRFSVKCLAEASSEHLNYRHTPFTSLEHGEDPAVWEQLTGEYLRAPAFQGRPEDVTVVMPSSQVLMSAQNASRIVVTAMRLCPTLVDGATLEACADRVRRRRTSPSANLSVAVHVRRGDMMILGLPVPNPVRRDRVVPLKVYVDILRALRDCLPDRRLDVTVYSEGVAFQFHSLVREFGARIDSRGRAADAFTAMRASDILVVGSSSFSYMAALVHEGSLVVSDGREKCPSSKLPSWVSPSKFDCTHVVEAVTPAASTQD